MDNNKTIYAVMETDYSYWDIKGYFTNEKEAEKYVLAHPETRLHIERLKCFDGKEPQNNKIQTLYEHFITFDTGDYEKRKKPCCCYSLYHFSFFIHHFATNI